MVIGILLGELWTAFWWIRVMMAKFVGCDVLLCHSWRLLPNRDDTRYWEGYSLGMITRRRHG